MKTIVLSLPYDDHSFLITGSEKDKSVVEEIENNNGFYEISNMKLLERLIEFNPTPLKNFYNEDPKKLYLNIAKLYPYTFLVNDKNGTLTPIKNYSELLDKISQGKGWEDLYCTFNVI